MALLVSGILPRLDELGGAGQDDIGLLMDIRSCRSGCGLRTRRGAPADAISAATPSAPKRDLL